MYAELESVDLAEANHNIAKSVVEEIAVTARYARSAGMAKINALNARPKAYRRDRRRPV